MDLTGGRLSFYELAAWVAAKNKAPSARRHPQSTTGNQPERMTGSVPVCVDLSV